MQQINYVAYRYLTQTDFYNLYKPKGSEERGGGQSYIDFPTRTVSVESWRRLFSGAEHFDESTAVNGPRWTSRVRSIGLPPKSPIQKLSIYQRRAATVSVSHQYIHSSEQNRVLAWRPEHGFPEPFDQSDRHQRPEGLAVFLARTAGDQLWAGWFVISAGQPLPVADDGARGVLLPMLTPGSNSDSSGFLDLRGKGIFIDETNHTTPFRSAKTARLAPAVTPTAIGFPEVSSPGQDDEETQDTDVFRAYFDQDEVRITNEAEKTYFVAVRKRNQRAVRALKDLYGGRCQMTGEAFLFRKRDGNFYIEAHHLIPLGLGGADNPHNMILVCPAFHRMLHYANVQGIDLSRMEKRADGWSELRISINDQEHIISWHPLHAQLIETNAA